MAGPRVAVTPNRARPCGCLLFGRVERTVVSAIGIMTPPVKPWLARKTIMAPRLRANPQRQEKMRNKATLTNRYQRGLNTRESQAVSGMVMISPIK
jgi:hypothetical protein